MKTEEQIEKEQAKDMEVFRANVRTVLETRPGREVVWEIMSMCNMYSSLTGDFYAGERNVGLGIKTMLEDADPALYAKLLLENIENEQTD